MKIAALQMVSTPDVVRNLEAARRLIAHAAAQGARLVALPEYFCLLGRQDTDKLNVAEVPLCDVGKRPEAGVGTQRAPIQQALADAAREHQLWLIGEPCRCAPPTRSACATAAACSRLTGRLRLATTRCTCSGSTTARSATTKGACSKRVTCRKRFNAMISVSV